MMRYAMFDIEVTHPISELPLSPADTGAAILVRRKGVPIGFWMQEANGARRLSADDLDAKNRLPSWVGGSSLRRFVRR